MDDDTLLAILAVCLKRREKRRKRKKRLWVKEWHERNEFTYQNLLEELIMTEKNDFRHLLINDASIYEELLKMIGPLIKKQDTLMRDAIPVGLRLSTTLRFLATGDHFENMKFSSSMSANSISKVVLETCEAIISRFKDYMKLPETKEECEVVANDFHEMCDFPNCLGAVTGKHIAITKPSGSKCLYYNHKKFFSIVLMAAVNANYEFMFVDIDTNTCISGSEDISCTSFGKTLYENSLVMKDSKFHSTGRDLPYVFVGDNGFYLTEWYMKPFTTVLTREQEIYNYRLGRVHHIMENTFGSLFSLFGVLQKPINLAPEKVKTIVLACCYLYNFLRRTTESHLWDEIFDKDLEDGTVMKGLWRELPEMTSLLNPMAETLAIEADDVRDSLMEFFNNESEESAIS